MTIDTINTMNNNSKSLILIVDDNVKNIEYLGKLLSDADYIISIAMNGKDAVERIDENFLPDLILLDIQMPEMSGLEVCTILKQSELTRMIPVIFLSAKGESDDIVKAFEVGGVDYVVKPFKSIELLARIRTQLSLQKLMRDEAVLRANEVILRKKAEAANQAKSVFLANMSHEIRTPMNAILGFTEILKGMVKDPKALHYLEPIHSSGKALLSLINDILDLSKVEAEKLELQYSEVSLSELLSEVKVLFQQESDKKGLDFKLEYDSQIPEYLIMDPTRLRQVLVNTLDNALKFTDKGFIILSASLQESNYETQSRIDLRLSVKDSGIGIPKEQCRKVFDAFEQAKGQSSTKYGGTGLGLAITKHLVGIMGGTIDIESEVGQGATFTINLKGVEVPAIKSTHTQKEIFDCDSICFEQYKILICDDLDYNRTLIAAFLDQWGFELIEASDGQQAIDQAQQNLPDLILLDMNMPVLNGYEVLKIMNSDDKLSKIPTIAVTAAALKSDQETISKLCDGYISKPISKQSLVSVLVEFLAYTISEAPKKNSNVLYADYRVTKEDLAGLNKQLYEQLLQTVKIGGMTSFVQIVKSNDIEDKISQALINIAENLDLNTLKKLFQC